MNTQNDPLRAVEASLKERHISEGTNVGIALSGGTDSTALFHILCELRRTHRFSITGLHVNYHLRGEESDADEAFVRELTSGNGAAILVEEAFHTDADERNIQSWARRIRYGFFSRAAQAARLSFVLTAHHRDDQLETLFARLIRGTGTRGMRGIRRRYDFILRPLLSVPKSAVDAYIRDRHIQCRHDSSNASGKYTRNRIRAALIPALRKIDGSCDERILAFARLAYEQHRALTRCIAELYPGTIHDDDEHWLDISALSPIPAHARTEIIRTFLSAWSIPSRRAIENVISIIDSSKPNIAVSWRGTTLIKEYGRLFMSRSGMAEPFDQTLVPGSNPFPSGEMIMQAAARTGNEDLEGAAVHFDADRMPAVLHARSRRPGDTIAAYPSGMHKTVKDIFIDRKIPYRLRGRIPVITGENGTLLAICMAAFGAGPNICANSIAVQDDTSTVGSIIVITAKGT
ncbi:MAG: tRNA lysidine(34) synthetase TilS [Spirochaetota bacterium]|mgnify:CR=1 FL=1